MRAKNGKVSFDENRLVFCDDSHTIYNCKNVMSASTLRKKNIIYTRVNTRKISSSARDREDPR